MSQLRGLGKESSVGQRDREIGARLPLDQYGAVNQVVTALEANHLHVEHAALSSKFKQLRILLAVVNVEPVAVMVHGFVVEPFDDDDGSGACGCQATNRERHTARRRLPSMEGAESLTARVMQLLRV